MLQQQGLFPKLLPLKPICCNKKFQHGTVGKVIKDLFFDYLLQETHVVDICLNRLGRPILTNIHNICFLEYKILYF